MSLRTLPVAGDASQRLKQKREFGGPRTASSGVGFALGPAGSGLTWLHQESACIPWFCFPLTPSSAGRLSSPGREAAVPGQRSIS